MSEIYATGSQGERVLAEYLAERGRTMEESDTKTFDLKVDGQYAEVKSSKGTYAELDFIGLTDNQYQAILDGTEFLLFLVCNLRDLDNLEVIEIPSAELAREDPKIECTYYWYRSQLERIRGDS